MTFYTEEEIENPSDEDIDGIIRKYHGFAIRKMDNRIEITNDPFCAIPLIWMGMPSLRIRVLKI